MRMKIAWLPALIFCATSVLVSANLDLGPIIKIAQCRSTCLRRYTIDGKCLKLHRLYIERNDCDECWNACKIFSNWKTEERPNCTRLHQYQGCETARTFYQTRGMEEGYEPSKLPAPEENTTIHMNEYDIAVLMLKNSEGMWKAENYFSAKQQPVTIPDSWIIVIVDDGVVKHYSLDKWRPTLQSLKDDGLLFQANITWQDWRIQLKNQRITSKYFLRYRTRKEKQYKSSFIVTWQQETGDGIMGNQVTDSESAQISLPCGKYLVRVASNDGPGSYSIVVDTGVCKTLKISMFNDFFKIFLLLALLGICCFILMCCSLERFNRRCKKEIRSCKGLEEGLTKEEEELKEENLMQKLQKMKRNVLIRWLKHRLSPQSLHSQSSASQRI